MFLDPFVGDLCEPISGRRWDRGEIGRQVAARAARYASAGLGPGDRAFLHFGNRLEFFADLLALWRLGACAVPLDAKLTAFEVETLAAAATPRLALVDDDTDLPVAQAARGSGARVLATGELDRGAEPGPGIPGRGARLDDDALILFTSGSTGDPKGVVHTHRSLRARWVTLAQSLGTAAYRRTLCLLPTHFGHGLICNCLFPWLSGNDLFVTPPFRPDLVVRLGGLIDEHEISFLSSVPSVWRLALKLGKPPGRGSLARVHVGSAPLSAHLWEQIREWTATPEVFNAYGITETGSWVAGTTIGPFTPADGLVGVPWGAVVAVSHRGDTDAPPGPDAACAPGEEGYVWLNTPALMKGYFQRDDLTDRAVCNGWFLTGDIGVLDDRGYLTLRGRERDEINKGGMKIYPADVDAVVERFEGATDVCTFAVDDSLYGQNVGIAVALAERDDDSIRDLHAWLLRHLAEAKRPVRWYLVDAIPRTSRGKINRDAVKQACDGLDPLDLPRILAGGRGGDA